MVFSLSNSITLTNLSLVSTSANRIRVDVQSPATSGQGLASANAFILVLPDFDHDHIDDLWEAQFGLMTNNAADAQLDLDGDLMSNLQEYQAGTVPTDSNSVLRADGFLVNGGEASFHFLAISNRTYSVQFSDAVTNAPWINWSNVAAASVNRTLFVTNSPGALRRYFRIVTPQQP